MSHHIVQAKDLSYTYPDGTIGLKSVSFKITHGESVAIVGANGAGKSTLLLHTNGFLLATQGELIVGDSAVTSKNLNLVRKSVGMIFQNPDDQLFMPTVFDDVAFGPLNMGLSEKEVIEKVTETLSKVGALHLKDRTPHRLSLGEKKAVAIASVLSMSPDILVMDEPTSNLDPASRSNLINLLKTFTHTKIIATHDLDMAIDLCKRTIVLNKGEIMADGSTIELFKNNDLLLKSNLQKPLRMQDCPVCSTQN